MSNFLAALFTRLPYELKPPHTTAISLYAYPSSLTSERIFIMVLRTSSSVVCVSNICMESCSLLYLQELYLKRFCSRNASGGLSLSLITFSSLMKMSPPEAFLLISSFLIFLHASKSRLPCEIAPASLQSSYSIFSRSRTVFFVSMNSSCSSKEPAYGFSFGPIVRDTHTSFDTRRSSFITLY